MPRAIPSNAECKARIQRAKNAKKTNEPSKPRAVVYMVLSKAKPVKPACGCSSAVKSPNFNKYANKLLANRPASLPKPSSPRFANKVKSMVKQMHRTNRPNLPNLADNSSYISRAVAKLRTQLNRIQSSNRPTQGPAASKPVNIKKAYTKPREMKQTKSLFTQRKKQQKEQAKKTKK